MHQLTPLPLSRVDAGSQNVLHEDDQSVLVAGSLPISCSSSLWKGQGDSTSYNAANRDLASLIDEAVAPFTELVDWWQKDDLQRQMRSQIKRQLRARGIAAEAVESLAAEIVDLAKVRTDR